jgi:molybdopterin synthase sulfur carrier subunit
MVVVEFLGPIAKDSIELDVSSLDEVSQELKKDSELNEWLEKCAVAINDEIVMERDITLQSGDRVSLLPPVCGG